MSDPKTNKSVPNYRIKCENCGATPTVDIKDQDNKLVSHMELCGPCCFGEAAAIDPANW